MPAVFEDLQIRTGASIDGLLIRCTLLFRGTLLVAQLVEALRYKREGREFDSRWYHWIFSLT